MIIVSQNKRNIYNFDNVKSIDILSNEIYISDDILSDMGTCIAHYETEEKAKEVLQEIINLYKKTDCVIGIGDSLKQVVNLPKVYEIPEE